MKGVFLGAGASYEVGMPLVQEFSNTLRSNLLKRLDSKLFNFEGDTSLKEDFVKLLSNESLNYEEVVGRIEQLYLGSANNYIVHGILIQLIECIQLLLLEEQGNIFKFFSQKVKNYYGLKKFIEDQGIINVFSLNHDIVFEEICDYYKIPYRDGFFSCKTKYDHIANFRVLTSDQLSAGNFHFLKEGEAGINLIKLHGSFDIFAAEDKNLFLKCYGDGSYVGANFKEIRKIEDYNLEISKKDKSRIPNELCLRDSDGELQFFRRSLLSGAHKFKGRFEQIAPVAFLDVFKSKLKDLEEIIFIGYGFGDPHINAPIKVWMSSSETKRISIFDPERTTPPECLLAYTNRINIVNGGLTDFCLQFDSSKETSQSLIVRDFCKVARENLKKRRLAS